MSLTTSFDLTFSGKQAVFLDMIRQGPTNGSNNSPEMAASPLVLKVPEFGKRYQVNTRTIYAWLKRGLPHLKLGPCKTRIPVREADEWVSQNFYRQRER